MLFETCSLPMNRTVVKISSNGNSEETRSRRGNDGLQSLGRHRFLDDAEETDDSVVLLRRSSPRTIRSTMCTPGPYPVPGAIHQPGDCKPRFA
jgi:hypothetical protein